MSARKRRPVSRRDDGLVLMPPGPDQDNRSATLVDHLLNGPADLDGIAGFETEDEEKRCWETNRAMILGLRSDHAPGDDSYPAGNRPWAWWKYTSDADPAIWASCGSIAWSRAQWDYLVEHKLINKEERAAAQEICARRLLIVEMSRGLTEGDPVAQRRYRSDRAKYVLADEAS